MDVETLRAATPGCAHRVHFNNAGAALMAQPTLDAMTGHLRLEAEFGGYEAASAAAEQIADAYHAVAALVGGSSTEVAMFDNATHAWNAAFYSVPLQRGDRILTGRAEYGSNVLAYFQVAQWTGAEVVVVPNDESGQLDVAALADLVDDRTRLISITHVPTGGGLINPAIEIGRVARASGALYLLDAAQSVGQLPIDVAEIGCDMLTGTGRKFLRGPRGTGFLWVSSTALDRLDPFVVEIRSAEWDGRRGFTWVEGARRFETWENSYVNLLGLGAAVRQALDLGVASLSSRAVALGSMLRDRLDALERVSTYDLGAQRCAIVTARVEGMSAAEVAAALGRNGINVSVTSPEHAQFDTEERGVHPLVRLSPHYYNTEAEVDTVVAAVAELAAR